MNVHFFSSTSEAYDDSQTGYFPEDFDWDAHTAASHAWLAAEREHGVDSPEAKAAFKLYDNLATQVADGDILVVASEGVVGIMVSAWPTAITTKHGSFHALDDSSDWDSFEDGKYAASAKQAWEIIETGVLLRAAEEKKVEIVNVVTSEIREGDIVLCHGLRLLVDRPIEISQNHPDSPGVGDGKTRWTKALVLNRDDVPSEVVPHSWTADWDRTQSWEARPHNGEHRWSIQGNDLAWWSVEREVDAS